jgi:hypothetical protein
MSIPHPISWTTPFQSARPTARASPRTPNAPSSRKKMDNAGATSMDSSWNMTEAMSLRFDEGRRIA